MEIAMSETTIDLTTPDPKAGAGAGEGANGANGASGASGTNAKYPIAPARLIEIFSEAGYSPTQVSHLLGNRISFRALYRWKNGEALPQRYADYVDVMHLAEGLGLLTANSPPAEAEAEAGAEAGAEAEGRTPRVEEAEVDVDDVSNYDMESFCGLDDVSDGEE
jgi:hypothetical protein